MGVEVASRLGQAISRTFSSANVVGDGMLVRLRSTTIGILGLVAAVGLGLVGVISQQGWPEVASGPPPQVPLGLEQNDPIAMPRPVADRTVESLRRLRPIASIGLPVSVTVPPSIGAGAGGVPADNVGTDQPKTGGDHAQPPSQPISPTVVIQTPGEGAAPAESSSLPEPGESPASAPGRSGESHGRNGEPHGNSSTAPGHSGESRGRGH